MRPEAGDVTDAQWAALEPHAGRRKRRGPKSRVDPRLVVNAIFDRMRTGCRWRMPPKEYGSRELVYGYWCRRTHNGAWARITTARREAVPRQAGRRAKPTGAIVASQSVGTVQKGGGAASMRASGSEAARGLVLLRHVLEFTWRIRSLAHRGLWR